MPETQTFVVTLELLDNYRFQVDFGDFGQILTDEPEPLGESLGPNPGRLLAASVANCLAASLLFAVGKFGISLYLATTGVATAFGAAGAVVALLIWVYWSAQIFLFGAEFAFALGEFTAKRDVADKSG